MLRKLRIKNYKSILDHELELGRFNVFIGENGSGKTNILEAVAMASAALDGQLDTEALYSKGIRIAKPSVTVSSFPNVERPSSIELRCGLDVPIDDEPAAIQLTISSAAPDDIRATWTDVVEGMTARDQSLRQSFISSIEQSMPDLAARDAFVKAIMSAGMDRGLLASMGKRFMRLVEPSIKAAAEHLADFVIFNLNLPALRGIQAQSRKTPLGIYGENLDVLISTFDDATRERLAERARLISWFDAFEIDVHDERKYQGHKLGRSTSTLYFRDRFMRPEENVFSAENANEGILHILFYLVLFLSDKTPRLFGIDNIETALNPALCRELTRQLALIATEQGKQVLITTHNPAILDGLDLHDDEQRLFVVYRDDDGHTVTKRIRLKPESGGTKHKLSELWMRGHLGGIPKLF